MKILLETFLLNCARVELSCIRVGYAKEGKKKVRKIAPEDQHKQCTHSNSNKSLKRFNN